MSFFANFEYSDLKLGIFVKKTINLLINITMIPREIHGQVIFAGAKWSTVMDNVKKYWDQGMFITDFDYGGGVYVVVMSKVKGWNGQAIRHGSTLPVDAISELWDKNYYLTNALYDGQDWVVVMTGVDYCSGQSYFTHTSWTEFTDNINQGWEDDKVVTKLCCEIKPSYNKYFAIMTRFRDCSPAQSRRYLKGRLLIQDLESMCVDGKYIVDVFDFDGGAFVVTAGKTGWDTCKVVKSRDFSTLLEKVKNYWDKDYYITTITFYESEWFAVLGKKS